MSTETFRGAWRARLPAVAGCALLAGALLSCHGSPPTGPEPPLRRLVWPSPPARARVEYVRSFRVPGDLGIRRSWVRRFLSYLARGRRAQGMVRPYAITTTPDGRIVVADPDARCVHVYDTEQSRYLRLTKADGAPLISPVGVAADSLGRIYVSDSQRGAVYRYGPKGEWSDTLGAEELSRPTGLAFDRDRGLLYVIDTLAHRIVAYTQEGKRVREIGGRGVGRGQFNYPVAVAVGQDGLLYVSDSMNFRVQIIDPEGRFLASFGKLGRNPGDFDKSKGIALDPDGHIYVVDALHDVVQIFDAGGQLLSVVGGSGMGAGEFWLPAGIHIDAGGRILVADSANRRVQIFRYLGSPDEGAGG